MSLPRVTTRRLELDGFDVFLREVGRGAGEPLLCLHGGPGLDGGYFFPDAVVWGPGLAALADHHHVIAYDQRGCGESGTPDVDQPLALSRHVDDVEAVRAALGLGPVAVFGHSFGSVLALLFALRHPGSVARLLVSGGAPTREFQDGYRKAVAEELAPEARDRLDELGGRTLTDDVFRDRFAAALPLYFHRELAPAERQALLDSTSFSARANRALAAGLEGYDLSAALAHVRVPALVVYGVGDRVVRPEYQLDFRGKLPTARFVAFQESGHFPFLEEPEPFARVAHYFLRHGDRRTSPQEPA